MQKRFRRLITHPVTGKMQMAMLYEYPAKVGTQGSTIIWTVGKPETGRYIFGFCLEDRYTPYMPGQAFRYAQAVRYFVTSIQKREKGDFLILSK